MRALARSLVVALPAARRSAAATLSDPHTRTALALAAGAALAAAAAAAAFADGARLRRRVSAAEAELRQLRGQLGYVHSCLAAMRGYGGGWRADRGGAALPSGGRTRIYIN